MKILHIAPFFTGGVGIVAKNLTYALSKLGNDVVVASPANPPEEIRQNISTFYKLRELVLKDPLYVPMFALLNKNIVEKIIRDVKPDIILTHGSLILLALLIKTKIPWFSVVHGTYFNELKYMWQHPIRGIEKLKYWLSIGTTYHEDMEIYRYVTKKRNIYLVAVSKRTRQELIDAGVNPQRVFSVLNGVDKNIFKPMDKDKNLSILEKKYGVEVDNERLLLHVNPGAIKGTHILIKSIAILKKILKDRVMLLVVGNTGPSTYRSYIERLVKEMKLEDTVKFIGRVPHEELPYFYNIAELTIAPSYSEGGPLVILESLACGTPVVATEVGGNSEYLRLALPKPDKYLVEIKEYDFSKTLAEKIGIALSYRAIPNIESIPSWFDIAKIYLRLFREKS
ncbi:glycosyltransferase family 4 protein [Pyrobaculum sp.]|uniref:glycosyltransferase family 4 protein n=1 Tax=Pyrobaculum sp. TaxID=2004705 RepID=UPI0031757D48